MTTSSWPREEVLADGGRVQMRPIRASDAPALVALHGRLSEESVYLRYFSPHSRLSAREIERATSVDHRDREALVALDGDQLIGVASYERQPGSDSAEVAFEVEDAHQGRGIGTLLFESLAASARAAGIRRFFAQVLPQNRRMLQLFRDVGLEERTRFEGGVVDVELALSEDSLPALSAEELQRARRAGAYPEDRERRARRRAGADASLPRLPHRSARLQVPQGGRPRVRALHARAASAMPTACARSPSIDASRRTSTSVSHPLLQRARADRGDRRRRSSAPRAAARTPSTAW